MCGISDIVCDNEATARRALRAVVAAQIHRGPDDAGEIFQTFGIATLGLGTCVFQSSTFWHKAPPSMHPETGDEVVAHDAWADVFLLPSICGGSATVITVIYETLAAGLPVVTTANAGSVVRDGIEGYICPPSDTNSLCEKLELLVRDREALRTMSRQATRRAKDYGLAGYGRRLLVALELASSRVAREPRKVA